MSQQDYGFEDVEDAGLSAEESAILEKLIKGQLSPDLKADKIPRREVHSPAPLSFSQQRLWVLDRLLPDNPFYNLPYAFQVTGEIDISIFEQSLNEIIRRHESLRTIFTMENEEPAQVILPEIKIKPGIIDLRGLPGSKQEEETIHLFVREAGKPFDLEHGPLVRAVLIRLDEGKCALLFNMHHIIFDSWSMQVFIRELGALYTAFSAGNASPLSEPSLQYADFALWQRQRQEEILEKQLSYWRELLSGELPILELPTDRQRPTIPGYRGDYQTFELSETITDKLTQLNRQEQCSMFMTLLTAFNVLLYRYCGQDDILVGSPIANRNRAELEDMIGFFVNTLVFRTHLSGYLTFRQLLARVQKAASTAYDNQDLPFEKLVEEFQPDRYMSHTPLFQVMCNYTAASEKTGQQMNSSSAGLNITKLPVHNKTSKFDLWLTLGPRENKLGGGVEYNTDIFAETTITRLISHFNTLLAGIIANPDQRINDLSLMSEEEKYTILEKWNDTAQEYDIQCLHHAFEEQVEKTPDQVALKGNCQLLMEEVPCGRGLDAFGEMYLNYRELNERANQLAGLLIEKGVRPDTIVGIVAERSIEMVVGLMGILKAGGAYLPIDPEYPEDRVNYMLKDSNVGVLATTPKLQAKVKAEVEENSRQPGLPVQFIHIHTNPAFASQPSLSTLTLTSTCQVSPTNLAYVIYTSGSTGKPKGVQVPHQGISNRLHWMQEFFRLTSDDRVLQKTPFTFDVSVWEFFWPLLNGAGLVMAKPGGHKDCTYLVETIQREKITTIHFVPSMLHAFIEEPGLHGLDSLKRVIASGEVLSKDHVQGFYRSFPGAAAGNPRLYNLYGPTEASVDVTYWSCEANDTHRSVPLGQPIANTRIYILDRSANPVPINVHGELHIAGIQLSRGYLNHPELTAERFCLRRPGGRFLKKLPPWTPRKNFSLKVPGKRFERIHRSYTSHTSYIIYKTGDLARWLPDGNIEFLGRLDFQVKVRGFRIELGEIESKLRSHPYLEDAVVLARSRGDNPAAGEKKLAAYVVLRREYRELYKQSAQLILELRNFLRERLPEYMTPSYFIPLEKLPLTANGKLDRKKLPSYETALTTGGPEKEAIKPQTSNERFFVDTWKQVLELEQVGINQSFFQLGGDSVEAVRMISRINQRGYRFTLQDLYKNQTIADLINAAKKIGEVKEPGKEGVVERTVPGIDREELARKLPPGAEIEDIYPATPLQCHMAACLNQQSHRVIERPVFIYQRRYQPTPKSPDISILKKAIETLFATYPYLRTLLLWRDMKEPLQVVCKKVDTGSAFIYRDFSQYTLEEQERRFYQLMNQEWQRGFEPDKDIPFRLVLVKLGENLVRYFYTGDYSRLDGWDAIFNFRTILAAYEALEAGLDMKMETDDLYPAYVSSLKKQDPQKTKEYWQAYFKGFSGPKSYVNRFPGNNPGDEKGFGQQQLYLSRETTAALHRILQSERLVFSPAACGLWAMVLSRYCHEQEVTYGILTTGRSTASAGIENMRGHSINILPIRITIPTDTLFLDWLKQIMEMQLEWVRHEYTTIDKIYEYLGLTPEPPLFDNFVVVQNLIRITAKKNPLYGPGSDYSLYHAKMEYPLRLDVDPTLNIGLVFHYYRQCVSDAVVKGLQENLKNLIESIAANPRQTIAELMELINPEDTRIEKNLIKPMVL